MSGTPGGFMEVFSQREATDKQISSADNAIKKYLQFAREGLDFQKQMWEQARSDFQPYLDLGHAGIAQLRDIIPRLIDTTLQPYSQQFRNFQYSNKQIDPMTGLARAPELSREIDFQFDPEDEVFKSKLDIVNKETDAWLAKQGLQNSSAARTIKDRAVQGLVNEEVDKQYGRDVANRNYLNQVAMQQYGLDADRGNALYGRMVDERGRLLSDDERALALLGRQYGVDTDLYNKRYGAASDWAKYGAGAAGSAGNMAAPFAQGISNTYQGMGNTVAGGEMYKGNAYANMMNNMSNIAGNQGNTFGNIMSMINRMRSGGGGYGGGGYGGGYAYSGGQPGMTDTYDLDYGYY